MYLTYIFYQYLHNIIIYFYGRSQENNLITKLNFDIEKYDIILNKIDDYIVLNKEDIDYINTLPNDKLIYIIKIYNNSYTETIQELLIN